MTRDDRDSYEVRFLPQARRAIAERLPESVAAAVIELCAGPLTTEPGRVGRPLSGPLEGLHGARRATYRVIYRIVESQRMVYVVDIAHRADVYRRR